MLFRSNQDQTISPQVTLWNQQGSQVIWGTLMVIPIEESLIYVRPLYLRGEGGRIPELRRVLVAYGNDIVMAETLTRALVEIFDRSVATALAPDRLDDTATSVVASTDAMPDVAAAVPADATLDELALEAQAALDASDKALKAGDWTAYGEAQKRLRDIIVAMRKKR